MFIEMLARLWAVNDELPTKADLLVAVSHGATPVRPALGTKAVCEMTDDLWSRCYGRKVSVAYGVFSGSVNPDIEGNFKLHKLYHGIYVGKVVSTIEECMKIKEALSTGWNPKVIVVVTDEAHSRRARIVWKTFFPNSDIRICCVKITAVVDPDSPMRHYRHAWTTFLFQTLPTPFFKYLAWRGPEYMARWATKIHQPIAK